MQSLEQTSPKDQLQQQPFQEIHEEEVALVDSQRSSNNSSLNKYDISSQEQCLSPLKAKTERNPHELEKTNSNQGFSSHKPPLKKSQSINQGKYLTKSGIQKTSAQPDSPVKLNKSVSTSPKKKFTIKGAQFPLMEGQDLLAKQECLLLIGTDKLHGFLVITNYRMLFLRGNLYYFDIPLGFLSGADRQVQQKPIVWSKIEVYTKFGKIIRLRFNTQPEASNQVFKIIRKYSSGDITTLFAFAYARYFPKHSEIDFFQKTQKQKNTGWDMNILKDYELMGIHFNQDSLFQKVNNISGKLCPVYPSQFIITKRVKEETLSKCIKARTRDRIPVLSYYHHDPKTKKVSCMWRAAHCRSNVTSTSRNFGDQEYVKCLALEQNKQKSLMLLVYDIRPKTNALNVFYENSLVRPVNDLHSLLLMRESFNKLAVSYNNETSTKWVNTIQDSKWFEQLSKLLTIAQQIAMKMKNGNPILIQCVDGTDRSAQLTTLTQLILCPRYRTIQGFHTLINKQFVWLGYPFADRLRGAEEQRVPTLIQLLDCIHQLTIAFPLSFQFNGKYLASLAEALYNNKYGNFITNSTTQFANKNISQFSLSFWGRQPSQIEKNSYFKKNYLALQTLRPIPPVMSLKIWHEFLSCLSGQKSKSDLYKFHPAAQDNRDYLILQHKSMKNENSQFKLLLKQQQNYIQKLQKELKNQKIIKQQKQEQFNREIQTVK